MTHADLSAASGTIPWMCPAVPAPHRAPQLHRAGLLICTEKNVLLHATHHEKLIYFPSDTATLWRFHSSSSSIYMVLTHHPSSVQDGTRGKLSSTYRLAAVQLHPAGHCFLFQANCSRACHYICASCRTNYSLLHTVLYLGRYFLV